MTRIRYFSTVGTRVQAYANAVVKLLGKYRKLWIERRLGVLQLMRFGLPKGNSMFSDGEEFPWVMKALVLRVCSRREAVQWSHVGKEWERSLVKQVRNRYGY